MINYQIVVGIGIQWYRIGSVINVEHSTNGGIVRLVWLRTGCIILILEKVWLIKDEDIEGLINGTNVVLQWARAFEWTPEEIAIAVDCFHAEIGVAWVCDVQIWARSAADAWLLDDVTCTPCGTATALLGTW